nr:Guanine nucleotide-binding-like protein 1 [Polyrhizophydium stewartii]
MQTALEVGFEDLYPSGDLIDFPKRPPWSAGDTRDDLEQRERAYFDVWLRGVYDRFDPAELSYFEHNLEVWRQLWRVVEISDIVLFVVDARHPILHFPPTLYDYIVTDMKRELVLVFNKALDPLQIDLVPQHVLEGWKAYFQARFPRLTMAEFSCFPKESFVDHDDASRGTFRAPRRRAAKRYAHAVGAMQLIRACRDVHVVKHGVRVDWDELMSKIERDEAERAAAEQERAAQRESESAFLGRSRRKQQQPGAAGRGPVVRGSHRGSHDSDEDKSDDGKGDSNDDEEPSEDESDKDADHDEKASDRRRGSDARSEVDSAVTALDMSPSGPLRSDLITIGIVGHPNVGKSSLINGIMGRKVVSASHTPGHTKHFQTMHLTREVRLCDCPGLVFPSKLEKPLQILSGMYRIAQVQEPYSTVTFLAERIPIPELLHLDPPGDADRSGGIDPGFKVPTHRARELDADGAADDKGDNNDEGGGIDGGIDTAMPRAHKTPHPSGSVLARRRAAYAWSGWTICEALAIQRGFLTPRAARPDVYRAANLILRMANDGRLLLVYRPPGTPAAPADSVVAPSVVADVW